MLRVRIKRGNGMNVRVDKSRRIVTLMVETVDNINPIETLRSDKQIARFLVNQTGSTVPGKHIENLKFESPTI